MEKTFFPNDLTGIKLSNDFKQVICLQKGTFEKSTIKTIGLARGG